MSITFLLREAGIAAALGRRGPARPAVLWCLPIAAGLKECKNLVNDPPQYFRDFAFALSGVSPRDIQPGFFGLQSSSKFCRGNSYFKLGIWPGNLGEVQISLDFIGGQRSIVTFRLSAGDTMMRERIYASRG
jgi:hypothetical protein